MNPVIIVGAGHAGVAAAAALREEKYSGPIVLVSDEIHTPYQRPALSKAYLKGSLGRESLVLRGPAFYGNQRIDTKFGDEVVGIDRVAKQASFASGQTIGYEHLILATGARARPAPFAGADLAGVITLRDLDDADRLKHQLETAKSVVVIGAGFIGLEFAATAVATGKSVTVVEVAPRVMGRAVSAPISNFFAQAHREFGINLSLGASVARIEGRDGRVSTVHVAHGNVLPADLVLLGIGVAAHDELARKSGLNCDNGILVDAQMRSSDQHISAIGDCCSHPSIWHGGLLRLESVQNATDQARIVARRLSGQPEDYCSLPWFWSDQGDLKLQIAGLLGDADDFVVRGDPTTRSFSIFGFGGGTLRCVESVNRGGDHMAARRLLSESIPLSPMQAADASFDLKAHVMQRNHVA
jgi:3-phenylpropionate/trans-cinnamate dioxygenase ferredoxin reductase component